MKKLVILALVLCLALSLVACGSKTDAPASSSGGGSSSGGSGNDSGGDIDLNEVAANMVEEAVEAKSNSLAAAFKSIKARGLEQADVEPTWDYTVNEEGWHAYGDNSHGAIRFTLADENAILGDGDYEAWLKQVFDATAKASDDGHNIQGFSWGDGDVEKTWDDFINGGGWMETWSYKYNGKIIDVYVSQEHHKDAEIYQKDGEWVYDCNAVEIDIADGLQKGWDETWADMEAAFEEYGDEIEDALRDYTN